MKVIIPTYRIIIIGRGNVDQLKAMTRDDDSVHYTGPVDDVSVHIAKAKIGINPVFQVLAFAVRFNQYSFLGKPRSLPR